jgi:ABC-type multidrug transport system ATPase subunit
VNQLRSAGGAICFATQNVEEVGDHSDHVLVLQDGRVVYAGDPAGYAAAAAEVFG